LLTADSLARLLSGLKGRLGQLQPKNVSWSPLPIASAKEALAGARDVMAEWMSEDAEARSRMRTLYQSQGMLRSVATAGKQADASKFRDYLDWSEPVTLTSPHRLLAMLRGARAGFLSLHVAPSEEDGLAILEELFIKRDGLAADQVKQAAKDGYLRLLAPSMENETLAAARANAEEKAIEIFSEKPTPGSLRPSLGSVVRSGSGSGVSNRLQADSNRQPGPAARGRVIYPHDTEKRRTIILLPASFHHQT
jgi:protein Tex